MKCMISIFKKIVLWIVAPVHVVTGSYPHYEDPDSLPLWVAVVVFLLELAMLALLGLVLWHLLG